MAAIYLFYFTLNQAGTFEQFAVLTRMNQTIKHLVDDRKNKQGKNSRSDQTSDHYNCQWFLGFTSDTRTDRSRQQANHRHQRSHDHRSHATDHTFAHRTLHIHFRCEVFSEHRDQDHPVLDTDPEECYESDTGTNTEIDSRYMQG